MGLRAGNRRALARALSRAESQNPRDRAWLDDFWKEVGVVEPAALRVAITGPPGAGKSTLIGRLGLLELEAGHRVAVLPIDPSSRKTGGSLLADKTRMEALSRQKAAFVRPSAAGKMLGGLALHTLESIELCELAGYDRIFVETVGVGQSEVDAALVADVVLLVVSPGAGDELQALKRGINEACDLVVVNKADGDALASSRLLVGDFESAGSLYSGSSPDVLMVSAKDGTGVSALSEWLTRWQSARDPAARTQLRRHQRRAFFERLLATLVVDAIARGEFPEELDALLDDVDSGRVRAPSAAQAVVDRLFAKS